MDDVLERYRRMMAEPHVLAADPFPLMKDMAEEIEHLRRELSREVINPLDHEQTR